MRRLQTVGVLALALLGLAGCGGGPEVTKDEATSFQTKVSAADPYMAGYKDVSDFQNLADSVCSSIDGGQTYARVSKTVAAYIKKDPSDATVDTVIKFAVQDACPELDAKLKDIGRG